MTEYSRAVTGVLTSPFVIGVIGGILYAVLVVWLLAKMYRWLTPPLEDEWEMPPDIGHGYRKYAFGRLRVFPLHVRTVPIPNAK